MRLLANILLFFKYDLGLSCTNKNIFVAGYYCTGTRWLNLLIKKNTCSECTYVYNNQHMYEIDNHTVVKFPKHGRFDDRILKQRNLVIVYTITDYHSWVLSFLQNTYDARINSRGIVSSTYGWPSMHIYDLYAHVYLTNIQLLRNSNVHYILVHLEYLKKSKGLNLLRTLSLHGYCFTSQFSPITKHTKSNERHKRKLRKVPRRYEPIYQNTTLESLIRKSYNSMEVHIS